MIQNVFQDLQKITDFGGLEFLSKQAVEGFITGLHKSPLHGFSVEFAEHRAYNQGESTRHIDWKLFARTDKLFIKKYQEETNLRCHILLDVSSSMYYPEIGLSKLQFSIFSVASIVQLLKKQRDAFSLTTFSNNIEFESEAKSSQIHQRHIFTELEKLFQVKKVNQHKSTSVAEVIHQIAEKIHKRSLVVLFTDMFLESNENIDTLFSAIQHLKYKKHEVIVFHVIHRSTELAFEYDNRPYQFMDLETQETIKLNPLDIKEYYRNSVGEYFREIKNKCLQYKIDFIRVNIEEGYEEMLRSFLLKREKMY